MKAVSYTHLLGAAHRLQDIQAPLRDIAVYFLFVFMQQRNRPPLRRLGKGAHAVHHLAAVTGRILALRHEKAENPNIGGLHRFRQIQGMPEKIQMGRKGGGYIDLAYGRPQGQMCIRDRYRSGDGKNISDHSVKEAEQAARRLQDAGIALSALGSPIGKVDICLLYTSLGTPL